jgi:hypothetical protein
VRRSVDINEDLARLNITDKQGTREMTARLGVREFVFLEQQVGGGGERGNEEVLTETSVTEGGLALFFFFLFLFILY